MKTDIKKVREASKLLFDVVDPTPACEELGSLFLCHPYTNSSFVAIRDDGQMKMVEIYNNKENYLKWRDNIFEKIDSLKPNEILHLLINNPWYLTWLKFVKPYLSLEDFSELLGKIWVNQENPNCDCNVPIKEAIRWFNEANKQKLMNSNDYEIYLNLPDEIEVYRGVSVGRNKNGLSYTMNREKAEWFQKRFETDNKKGYLIHAIVKKKDVLAYFNTRDEDELVINSLAIEKEIY